MNSRYTFFYKNQIILVEPQCSYCFSKLQGHLFLFYSCDNYNFSPSITHTYIYHPHGVFLAGYVWFEEKFYIFILKFVYITFSLLAVPQTMLQLKMLMALTLFCCKVSSEIVHSVHSLLICVSSFNRFDLFLTLEVFLDPCIQPGHCS